MGCFCCAIIFGGVALLGYGLYLFITERNKRLMLEKYNNTQKDLVIFHAYPRGRSIPIGSPWSTKLESYLRLTNIKYEHEGKDCFGPKGKTPWISLNGKHLGDSELIMDFLNKKFEKNLNTSKTSATDLAHAKIIRVMLEEFLMWGIGFDRLVFGNWYSKCVKIFGDKIPKIALMIFAWIFKRRAYGQGIGRHSEEEIVYLMTSCLKAVSVALGNKKYFGGDEICQEDCGIFGVLANSYWGAPDSPYEALMNGELKNLKEYIFRMREKIYPDWDSLCTA